jgi:hypothetical protein
MNTSANAMPETETIYRASCHCQSIVVEFKTDERLENKEHIVCNCSICTKNGYVNYYVPKLSLHFVKGETDLKVRCHTLQHELFG